MSDKLVLTRPPSRLHFIFLIVDMSNHSLLPTQYSFSLSFLLPFRLFFRFVSFSPCPTCSLLCVGVRFDGRNRIRVSTCSPEETRPPDPARALPLLVTIHISAFHALRGLFIVHLPFFSLLFYTSVQSINIYLQKKMRALSGAGRAECTRPHPCARSDCPHRQEFPLLPSAVGRERVRIPLHPPTMLCEQNVKQSKRSFPLPLHLNSKARKKATYKKITLYDTILLITSSFHHHHPSTHAV